MTKQKNQLVYQFETVGHGDEDGFNDPVKTTFDTNLSRVVAREAIQNIIDASLDNGNPARAEFHLHPEEEIEKVIPNLDDLKRIMRTCREYYSGNKQCVAHFDHAIKILKSPTIPVLQISDYNTKGLGGDDDDRKGDYYCFLKSVGASAKDGEEGGSFGLGKGSFYASSALNTIFVSSVYGKNKYVFQGKLRLVTHKGLDGKIMRGNGSFGLKDEQPVRDAEYIPEYFRRKERGTDIFIPGYKDAANGRLHIIKSVLSNFWYAILKKYLVVSLHDDIEINAGNLERLIHEYYCSGQPVSDDESNLYPYYDAYSNGQVFKKTLPTLGAVELRLIQKHGYPKKVACMRKTGMLIQEKPFSSTVSYAGVFICENEKGNAILRDMESPNHDKWERNSAHSKIDGEPRPEIVRADKEYRSFIRSKIKEMTSGENRQEINIGGLEQYLYLNAKEDLQNENSAAGEGELKQVEGETAVEVGIEIKHQTGNVSPQASLILIPKVEKGEEDPDNPDPEAVGKGEGSRGGGNGGGGDGIGESHAGGYTPEEGDKPVKRLSDLTYRSFASQSPSGNIEHVLILRNGKPNTKCSVKITVGTDDAFDTLAIKKASGLSGAKCEITQDNRLKGITFDSQGEAKIKVQFESDERYSLCPVAYEDK